MLVWVYVLVCSDSMFVKQCPSLHQAVLDVYIYHMSCSYDEYAPLHVVRVLRFVQNSCTKFLYF